MSDKTLLRVLKLAAEQAGMSDLAVKPEDSLVADLRLDSLDCIELTMACEDVFDLSIPEGDAEKCVTVADCASLVDRFLAGVRAA